MEIAPITLDPPHSLTEIHPSADSDIEDSLLLKVYSCLPLIGIFMSRSQEASIAKKIEYTMDNQRLIDLTRIKNDYISCNIASNMLMVAWLVHFSILPQFGVFLATVPAYFIFSDVSRLIHNHRVINFLKTTTFVPGLHSLIIL